MIQRPVFSLKTCRQVSTLALCGILLASPPFVCAVEGESPYLLGGWGGAREEWSARGLDLEAVISTDVLGVIDGGIDEEFEAPSNLDLILSLDTAAAGWWQIGRAHV